MGDDTKVYYENGAWHEYESVWDGRELLPPYPTALSYTADVCDQMQHATRTTERRAPKTGYRIAGRLRRQKKDKTV